MQTVLAFMSGRRHVGRRVTIALAALAIVMLLSSTAGACPTCKVALASHDKSQGDFVGAYFWSILFMMAMPFVILASIAGYMYLLVRRARAARAAMQQAAQTPPAEVTASSEVREPVEV